jgi:phenylacetic acid degradation operon negative regulatory protein
MDQSASDRTGSRVIDDLVDRIQARRPLRAWSLIVTIYGDAVVPRGGSLWLGSLLDMMAVFSIRGGVVRTAMSRLAKDGWIERRRLGRQSYYSLSTGREREFAAAARQIYAAGAPGWDGRWTVALLPEPAGAARQAKRANMERIGFAPFAPNVLLRPSIPGETAPEREAFLLDALGSDRAEGRRLAATLWPLDDLALRYRRFLAWFDPVLKAIGAPPPGDLGAFVVRIALIHEYRRLVLHDPALPAELLPEDWPGTAARALARSIYSRVLKPSERWLDAHAKNEHGSLPPPDAGLFQRFGGIRGPSA